MMRSFFASTFLLLLALPHPSYALPNFTFEQLFKRLAIKMKHSPPTKSPATTLDSESKVKPKSQEQKARSEPDSKTLAQSDFSQSESCSLKKLVCETKEIQ